MNSQALHKFTFYFGLIVGLFIALASSGVLSSIARADDLSSLLRNEIAKNYPGARIEIGNNLKLHSELPAQIRGIRILSDNARGEIQFLVHGSAQEVQGSTDFSAMKRTWIAQRRILPGEKLNEQSFLVSEVNVASGLNRESRGIMLPETTELTSLEARQTILEGSFPLTTGVQRVPDVRRGDSLRILLTTGDITLSTSGTAQEPAYLDGTVRVLTQKTKRELVGQLKSGGVVEVKL